MSPVDDLPPLREVIRRHDLKPRKSLGQNFLLDLNLTARIARAGGPLAGITVVEISRSVSEGLMAGGSSTLSYCRMSGSRTNWLVGVPGGLRNASITVRSRRKYICRKSVEPKNTSRSRLYRPSWKGEPGLKCRFIRPPV